MSFNSSFTASDDFLGSTVISYINVVFSVLKVIILLTFSPLILYLGHQQWRQHRSFKTASHSDVFTYHVSAIELIWVLGSICSISSFKINVKVGSIATSIAYYGEIIFHALTCVERYLAVVHPITYLGLRNAHGVRIRTISIGFAWLLCFALIGVGDLLSPNNTTVPLLWLSVVAIIIMSFCSLSVLCVLIRPGPVDRGGEKTKVDQSKQKAFYTITAITCTLWLWFVGLLVATAIEKLPHLSKSVKIVVGTIAGWFNLPSCMVLPLLYLNKTGKLSKCCVNE